MVKECSRVAGKRGYQLPHQEPGGFCCTNRIIHHKEGNQEQNTLSVHYQWTSHNRQTKLPVGEVEANMTTYLYHMSLCPTALSVSSSPDEDLISSCCQKEFEVHVHNPVYQWSSTISLTVYIHIHVLVSISLCQHNGNFLVYHKFYHQSTNSPNSIFLVSEIQSVCTMYMYCLQMLILL